MPTAMVSGYEETLRQLFGLSEFRPGQREVISALMERWAALAVFPTGGGKSLCYQLPAVLLEGLTVVVSPLIALMKDQVDALRAQGVRAAQLDSTLNADEALAVTDSLRSGDLKLLYVAPERFTNERFVSELKRAKVALFAVDEAHCISEWGHNFRPDYLKLARISREIGAERVLALTATATPAVIHDICEGFGVPEDCSIVTGFYRPNLRMILTPVSDLERDEALLRRLQSRPPGPTIVYVTLQKTAERVAALLWSQGLSARAYHAGMESEDRTSVQEWWMASDRSIVVATIAFGMGIDKADVRYVYHYNLPKSLESYSQEIGRAGRDGEESLVEMFVCLDDVPVLENFAYGDTPSPGSVRALVDHVLSAGVEFDVGLYEWSNRFDMRQIVLRTALTYLELDGVIRQGTSFYQGYEFAPLQSIRQIIRQFPGEPGKFLEAVLKRAVAKKKWHSIDPEAVASALGQPRRRVARALEVLEERKLIELRVSDLRQRYTRPAGAVDAARLSAELIRRFQARERADVERLQQVVDLAEHDGCQVNVLVGHFGEERTAPCGHCSWCIGGREEKGLPPRSLPPLPGALDVGAFQALRSDHPDALGDPRQAARFLCGQTSPSTSRARLGRHKLFGALDAYRFGDVLSWCGALVEG